MCNRGTWRGFHTRYLKTPDGQPSPLVVMEQCTECGSYRARNAEGLPYVDPDDQQSDVRQDDGASDPMDGLPDPDSGEGGSVWGPKSGGDATSDDQGW